LNIVLLGLPGAGKGTQAAKIAESKGLVQITTGDLFRDNIRRETELGLKAKPYYESGSLVPDEITIDMLLSRLDSPDCAGGCLFDGFPRTLAQAKALDTALNAKEAEIDRVLYIEVPEKELISRVSGRRSCRNCGAVYHEVTSPPKQIGVCDRCGGELYQREDDKEEVVRNRLFVNQEQLEQLLGHYRKQGKLQVVDGNRDIESVNRDLFEALERR